MWAGGLLLLSLSCSLPSARPSILLVTFDTLRADRLGCLGHRLAETPNLDRLAAEGVLFEEARSHVPLTLPSHATILTGLLPPHHTVRGNGLFRLPSSHLTLAAALQADGYRTAAVVSSVVLDRAYGLDRGFAHYDDNQRVGQRNAFDYLERGASQVVEAVDRAMPTLDPPFFLWVHLYDPHMPWVAPEPFKGRHPGRPYDAEIAFADAAFGMIRRAAEARATGPLVIAATADHGESLGEHGENQHGYALHRGVLRVPLILAGGGLPKGRRVGSTVGLVDLAPTLAGVVGAAMPGTDGVSLRPHWEAPARAREEAPLWEESLHPLYDSGWAPLRGLLTSRWHLVDAPRPELYDRVVDPDDGNDLAAARPDVAAGLRAELTRLAGSLGDVPEPPVTVQDSEEERERRAKLSSLGYLSSGAGGRPRGARLDPKDGLPGFLAVEEAASLIEQGKGIEARDLLLPHSRRDPQNPRIWHQLGQSHAAAGELTEAAASLRRAIALDPLSEFIRYSYADVLRRSGDMAGQQEQLERIVATNPRAAEASLLLAALFADSDPSRSESILRASYEAGVRDADLLQRLGRQASHRGEARTAARYHSEAVDLARGDPPALLALGRAHLRAGEALAAVDPLTRCASGPLAFECRIELARAYVVGSLDLDAARRELLAARALATDDVMRREVDRRLAALEGMRRGGHSPSQVTQE